jgi:hypothetical protein
MPHVSKSNAATLLKRAQQYTALAQRVDWSPEVRRAFARRAAKCLERYDAAEREAARHDLDDTANEAPLLH